MKTKTIPLCLCLGLLATGCGPNARERAQQLAETTARQEFRQALTAMKVGTRNMTYQEFRAQRLALETCFEVHRAQLPWAANQFAQLQRVLADCDTVFHASLDLGFVRPDHSAWPALTRLNPRLAAKRGFSDDARENDPDFRFSHSVRLALTQTAALCDQLAARTDGAQAGE